MHRRQVLPLLETPVHEDVDDDRLPSSDSLATHHIKVELYVGVSVADARNLCQLGVAQLQQLPPLLLLYSRGSLRAASCLQLNHQTPPRLVCARSHSALPIMMMSQVI